MYGNQKKYKYKNKRPWKYNGRYKTRYPNKYRKHSYYSANPYTSKYNNYKKQYLGNANKVFGAVNQGRQLAGYLGYNNQRLDKEFNRWGKHLRTVNALSAYF